MGNTVPDSEENAKKCVCPTCPTYKKSQLTGTLFCGRGKAEQKPTQAGCLCPNCPVWKQYGLDNMYYCMMGKSADVKS